MNWLIQAAVAAAIALSGADAGETRGPADTPTTHQRYGGAWVWCEERFPYREDLQEACKWGAFEMLPTAPPQTQETQDA